MRRKTRWEVSKFEYQHRLFRVNRCFLLLKLGPVEVTLSRFLLKATSTIICHFASCASPAKPPLLKSHLGVEVQGPMRMIHRSSASSWKVTINCLVLYVLFTLLRDGKMTHQILIIKISPGATCTQSASKPPNWANREQSVSSQALNNQLWTFMFFM